MAELGIQTQVRPICSPRQSQGWVWSFGWGSRLCLFWALDSLPLTPHAHVSAGLPASGLRQSGRLIFLPSSVWGQSAICPAAKDSLSRAQTRFTSWAGKWPRSVETISSRGMNLAALPSWQRGGGQGPVSQRRQAQLQKGFCLRLGPGPECHSSVEAARPLLRGAPVGQGGKEREARLSSRERRAWGEDLRAESAAWGPLGCQGRASRSSCLKREAKTRTPTAQRCGQFTFQPLLWLIKVPTRGKKSIPSLTGFIKKKKKKQVSWVYRPL